MTVECWSWLANTTDPMHRSNFPGLLFVVVCFALSLGGGNCFGASPSLPPPIMTFLDNGQVRIGMDLASGGAVTFISSHDHPGNIINSADLGRQIQMSHYSGPWPYEVGDKKPHPAWAGLGWNPIQTGDVYHNPSTVLAHRNDGKQIYIKCRPMQWPLNNVPAECTFETWTTLEGPVIHMRFRLTNQRNDKTQYRSCPQELPAVYAISKLSRLMSYTGSKPFTHGALTHVSNDWHKPWPWARFAGTEGWAALVDENDWGLGVFKADGCEFHGGIYGDARSDDPKHDSTAYVAPIQMENLDYNIVYEHRTEFMVGKLQEIRQRFNEMASKAPPFWRFERDRQHWTLRDATDEGFPLNGAWRIRFGERKAQLRSGIRCWRADDAPELTLKASFTGKEPLNLRLYWRSLDDGSQEQLKKRNEAADLSTAWKQLDDQTYNDRKSINLQLRPDGKFHTYRIPLQDSPSYSGLITGLAIEPVEMPAAGDKMAIQSIELSPRLKRK
jgi:hypothetical protein